MPVSSHFTILYGSQTGQAQAIAEEIHENSTQHGLQSKLFCLSQTEKKFTLEKEPLVVFVVSTTGEGDPPDTMLKFMRRLKKKTLPRDHLKDCQFALLALGDTNYTNFCNNGKSLDRRLLALGAKHFYDTGYADDAVGLETVVDPWIDGLWGAVKKCLNLDSISNGITDHNLETYNNGTIDQDGLKLTMNGTSNHEAEKNVANDEEIKTKSVSNCDDTSSVKSDKSNLDENKDMSSGVASVETASAKPVQATLRKSVEPLSSSALSIPLLSAPYLAIVYDETQNNSQNKGYTFHYHNQFSMATIIGAKTLTSKDAVKTALEIELDITDCSLEYEPGGSFDILCSNDEKEVEELINVLGLKNKADVPFTVNVMSSTTKKVAVKPSYIPQLCTIRDALLHCLEIRTVPKKALLRMLVECTEDEQEKRRLQELCSKQGAADYQTVIRQPSASLLELLKAFPSCHPPFERLLEQLPQLSARPYSVASSPLTDPNKLKFVFNVVEFPPFEDLRSNRLGVCTGWFSRTTRSTRDHCSLVDDMSKMQLGDQVIKVPVAARKKTDFKLPDDPKKPIIMIGPGTGIAPFIGFLEQRKLECQGKGPREVLGSIWLFYGCRNSDKDYLYKDELQSYNSSGILTNLSVAFSREEGCTTRYVQDNLRLHSTEVARMLLDESAVVYVCGDAKNMAKDVFATFCDIIGQLLGLSKAEAVKEMMNLRARKQYHEDVWT